MLPGQAIVDWPTYEDQYERHGTVPWNSPIPQQKTQWRENGQVYDSRDEILNANENTSNQIDDQRSRKDHPKVVQMCHGSLQVSRGNVGLDIMIDNWID